MKAMVITAVTLALCLHQGCSLMCYYCPYETPSSQCTDTKNCTRDNMVCKTTVQSPDVGFPFDGTESVIRDCALLSSCAQSNDDELGNTEPIFCCNKDLCNNRGLFVNNPAVPTGPEIGMCVVGMSVVLITIRL